MENNSQITEKNEIIGNIFNTIHYSSQEQLNSFIQNKRKLANEYNKHFESIGVKFRTELPNTKAHYWLMCLELENKKERNAFLKQTIENKVMTRPIWQLIFKSPL